MRPKHRLLTLAAVLSLLSLTAPAGAAPVSAEDLLDAQANAGEWLMYGRNYLNQRFSPLDKITQENVGAAQARLRLLDRRQVRRPRGDAALPRRHALLHRRLLARVRARRPHRHGALVLGAEVRGGARGHPVLRPGQPRPRHPRRQGLRRHARRPPRGARTRRTARSPGSRRSTTGRTPTPRPARRWSWATW